MKPSNLLDILRQRAHETPADDAYIYLLDGETREQKLTVLELDRRARVIAERLRTHDALGRPVLLCYPPGLDYIEAFFGCVYAGAIAVPAYPPDPARHKRTLPRLKAILEDCGAELALTPGKLLDPTRELWAEYGGKSDVSFLATDPADDDPDESSWRAPEIDPASPAFLMYTSGSTGQPKGVVISHANAVHNVTAFHGFHERPCRAFVSWLPLFHDLGLVVATLYPLYWRAPSIFMSPAAFMQRPLRWLEAISRYRATTTAGPNFAFELCVAKSTPEERAGLDLSCLNFALNGAEPVRASTLERFTEAFAPHGFRAEAFFPAYGLSDATADASGPAHFVAPALLGVDRRALEQCRVVATETDTPGSVTLVGCGQGLPDQRLAIVDPEARREVAGDRVGEIWLSGPSVGQGYWNRPEDTERTFRARLEDGGDDHFFRTGDLGFVRDDEVFLIGRLSDMIILRGVNYFPEDIEPTIAGSHPALRPGCCAAFGTEVEDEERLTVVGEVHPKRLDDPAEVVRGIRMAVGEAHEVEVFEVALIAPGQLPKTSSGKIKRKACAAKLATGDLKVLHRWRAEAAAASLADAAPADGPGRVDGTPEALAIETWLVDYFARRLEMPAERVDVRAPFTSFGLPSVEAVSMVTELGRWLGRSLPATLAWDRPSIEALVRHLAAPAEAEAEARAPALKAAAVEPIAIVGMGCRLPGAEGIDALWDLLREGRNAVREVPEERWNAEEFFDPDPATPGKMISRWGGFLDQLDRFDASFFEISPREAVQVDPRQRATLEAAWWALEDAGIPRDQLAGSAAGVFIAALTNDYQRLVYRDRRNIDAYTGPGTATTVIANRLSYFLDLRGPSLTVDTACSGSLVAIHLAAQSLRSGETELALAGGISVNLLPESDLFFGKIGALAADGRCKSFDHRANGIVRSDGTAVVVLKTLSSALADGDRIHALIRGSAVNQDGRSDGIMAPSGRAQEEVLRRAYAQAGIAPGQVQYVEAHGTGTSLGDPIEAQALGKVLGAAEDRQHDLVVGSIKSNFGHSEATAGIAGLVKVVLAMKHRQIPPNLNFERKNPLLADPALRLEIPSSLTSWPVPDAPLVAGISSFGFGGTNAHMVIEEAPRQPRRTEQTADSGPYLLPLSARSAEALRDLAAGWVDFLEDDDLGAQPCVDLGAPPCAPTLDDAVYTARHRRTHFEHRLAVTGGSREELTRRLARFAEGEIPDGIAAGSSPPGRRPRLVFVFSGQGFFWPGMGRELAAAEPTFREVLEACDRSLRRHVDWSLTQEMWRPAESSRLSGVEFAQPAILAIQAALAALFRGYGVEPTAIVGQSLGEVAASHVAGALSLDDAVDVIYYRTTLLKTVAGRGGVCVVGLSPEQAELALAGLEDKISVAGNSSPSTCIVAGDGPTLERLLAALEKREIFCRRVDGIEVAAHSPQMDPIRAPLVERLQGIRPGKTKVPMFSTVSAGPVTGTELDAEYWGRNLREPFRFAEVAARLLAGRQDNFLELSPHPVLRDALRQCMAQADRSGQVIASLQREGSETDLISGAVGELYALGQEIRWPRSPRQGRPVSLPSYPWQRRRFWIEPAEAAPASAAVSTASVPEHNGRHPLLGKHLASPVAPGLHFWQTRLSPEAPAYLNDHRIADTLVLPGAAYLEMAFAGAEEAFADSSSSLAGVEFKQPLTLSRESPREVQLVLRERRDDRHFEVFSRTSSDGNGTAPGRWALHASGRIEHDGGEAQEPDPSFAEAIRQRCSERLTSQQFYRRMADMELFYGPGFQAVSEVWRRDGEALARLRLPALLVGQSDAYRIHPVLLDASLQMAAAAQPTGGEATWVPAGIESLTLRASLPDAFWCHSTLQVDAEHHVQRADVALLDDEGRDLGHILGLELRPVTPASMAQELDIDQLLYRPTWRESPLPSATSGTDLDAGGTWILLADRGGVGRAAAEILGGRALLAKAASGAAFVAGDGRWSFDAARRDHFDRLLEAAVDHGELAGVLDLSSLDDPTPGDVTAEDLDASARGGCGRVVRLVQALSARHQAARGQGALPALTLVTRGAQAVGTGDSLPDLASAPLWGLSRSLGQELPELPCTVVDIDPKASAGEAARVLVEELMASDGEDQVARRAGRRYVRRLEPAAPEPSAALPQLKPDGAYLITGGLGGLGLRIAQWLAERGARHLILAARSGLPTREQWDAIEGDSPLAARVAAVRELEASGVRVDVPALDVTDEDQLQRFVDSRQEPIRGVVHAAGVLEDRLLLLMDDDALAAPMRPKVLGAWLLHKLLPADDLDFFVLFSSAAALLGSFQGQAAYAAGNAFLDALAAHRQAAGLPALSVAWGIWGEVGLVAQPEIQAAHLKQGSRPLPPDLGLEILEQLMRPTERQLTAHWAAMAIDWPTWRQAAAAAPPMFEPVLESLPSEAPSADPADTDELIVDELMAAARDERPALLSGRLRELTAAVLRIEPRELDPEQSLSTLGIDSILTVELQNRIGASTGVRLPLPRLLEGPSLVELGEQILTELEPGGDLGVAVARG